MTIKISDQDFSSLLRLVERSQTENGKNQYVELFFEYPKEFGEGYILDIRLRKGFWLTITNSQRREYYFLIVHNGSIPYDFGFIFQVKSIVAIMAQSLLVVAYCVVVVWLHQY